MKPYYTFFFLGQLQAKQRVELGIHVLSIALFSSVPIFVKLRKKTISLVHKFVISGLPEHSLPQGDISQELFNVFGAPDMCDYLFGFSIITHKYRQSNKACDILVCVITLKQSSIIAMLNR